MGNWNATKQAYFSGCTENKCIMPEQPNCPMCCYGYIDEEDPQEQDITLNKANCLLKNCYV